MATTLNIKPLLQAVKTRLSELLTGHNFTVKAGGTAPVDIHLYRLPNSALAQADVDLCPFAIVGLLGGSDSLQEGTIRVRLIAGIYNEGQDGEGDADIEAIAAAILRLSEEQAFGPYYLKDQITFAFGDPESGAQNHPEYYLAVNLVFAGESVYLNQ